MVKAVGLLFSIITLGCSQYQPTSAECQAHREVWEQALTNRDWDCLTLYYEFKSHEIPDDESWRRATQRIDARISEASNAVVRCQAALKH